MAKKKAKKKVESHGSTPKLEIGPVLIHITALETRIGDIKEEISQLAILRKQTDLRVDRLVDAIDKCKRVKGI